MINLSDGKFRTKNLVKVNDASNRSTPNNGDTEDFEIAVPLKYSSNFWRTFEMLLINCEINLILTWSEDCVISGTNGVKYVMTNTNLFTLVVTLSTQDNAKLLQQLNSGFK